MNNLVYDTITNKMGKSRQTAYTWINEKSYPAEACLLIEQYTDGEVTPHQLRPDIFLPTKAQKQLCDVVNVIDIDECNALLVTAIINYFEKEQPDLFKQLINNLKKTKSGKEYLNKRMVYANEKL